MSFVLGKDQNLPGVDRIHLAKVITGKFWFILPFLLHPRDHWLRVSFHNLNVQYFLEILRKYYIKSIFSSKKIFFALLLMVPAQVGHKF